MLSKGPAAKINADSTSPTGGSLSGAKVKPPWARVARTATDLRLPQVPEAPISTHRPREAAATGPTETTSSCLPMHLLGPTLRPTRTSRTGALGYRIQSVLSSEDERGRAHDEPGGLRALCIVQSVSQYLTQLSSAQRPFVLASANLAFLRLEYKTNPLKSPAAPPVDLRTPNNGDFHSLHRDTACPFTGAR